MSAGEPGRSAKSESGDAMKKRTSASIPLFSTVLALGACAPEADRPSAAEGEKLFNDPLLAGSSNLLSCEACHPEGDGLANAARNPELASVINACIAGPLDGSPLAGDSRELRSLGLYVESLGGNTMEGE